MRIKTRLLTLISALVISFSCLLFSVSAAAKTAYTSHTGNVSFTSSYKSYSVQENLSARITINNGTNSWSYDALNNLHTRYLLDMASAFNNNTSLNTITWSIQVSCSLYNGNVSFAFDYSNFSNLSAYVDGYTSGDTNIYSGMIIYNYAKTYNIIVTRTGTGTCVGDFIINLY